MTQKKKNKTTRTPVKQSITLQNKREEGKKLLQSAQLERFKNRTRHRDYTIEFTCPEFTCICPMSGFPDFATLYIQYTPDEWCVELKSLKLYINRFRNQGVFHEDVVNLILDDFIQLLNPRKIQITGDFNVRGNIKTIIKAEHSKKSVST